MSQKKMMVLICAGLFLFISAGSSESRKKPSACAENTRSSPVNIQALMAYHFDSRMIHPVLTLELHFFNTTENPLSIRDGEFDVYLNPFNEDYRWKKGRAFCKTEELEKKMIGSDMELLNRKLFIGRTEIGKGDRPSDECRASQLSEMRLPPQKKVAKLVDVALPTPVEESMKTAYLLINYLGLPAACKTLLLDGTATLGRKDGKGWSYISNEKIRMILCPKTLHIENSGILFH